ncbi:CYTH and CHAD domain-containing protein [Herbiconiux ginsengi]|uniref:CHAD domain-containing protein n=1 Tax=Herbiconiux ginsengi TaxID=381665 RepID=A0A1H3Q9Y4_9MICO|nr:CYTH and CHAD domain-containing protein [Herbiconiux ginsengi]SDZ09888.1 CHAD domain-containing protein [Herbiconiux ginsengi]
MSQNESPTHTDPATHSEQVEIERKYSVGEELPLPDLSGVGEATGTRVESARAVEAVQLEAVYFDTADGALARQRIALRRRQGGHDEGWHIKLPAAEGRTELQWPLDVGRHEDHPLADDTVPREVLAPVRVHVRDHPLTPLARVSTTRRVTELLDASGALVAEVADDTVSATDAREGSVRLWREWEVELGPAAPGTPEGRSALLDEVEARLLAVGATVSPSVSKLAQAIGRTGLGSPAASASSSTPGGKGSPSPAAARVLDGVAELVAQVVALDPAVRADRPDAVHQMRTTVRRLRNVLATHRDLFDPEPVEQVRNALSRFGAVLGEVRDLEVRADWAAFALDELETDRGVDDPDARRRLVDDTRAEHDEAHARLVTVMTGSVYYRLLDVLDSFTGGAPVVPDAPRQPKKEARRTLRKAGKRALARSVKEREARRVLGPDIVAAAGALGALHDSRKAARRLRHAAEFATTGAAGVLGDHAESVGDAAEDLQDALGWHRDASLFAEYMLLTARRAEAAGEGSFTYGVLYQRSVDQARRALALAEDARRALKSAL